MEDVNSWLKQKRVPINIQSNGKLTKIKCSHKKDKVTGILYLQNILDNRLTIPPPLRILNALFGDQAAERIIFVTTHWDRVDTALGEAREAEMRHPLQALLSAGARTARLDMRKHSAWGIIQSLFPDLEGEEEYKRRLVEKRERREAEAKERRRIQEEVDGWGEWQGMDTEPPEQHIRPEGAGSDDRKEEDFETKEEADVRRLEAQNDECQDELEENTRNRNSEEVSVKVEQEATPTVDENVEEEARQEGQETEKSRWGTELQNRPAVMLPKQKRSRLFFTCCCRMM